MPISTHAALRYVTPLREGGSLPALVETEAGLYVVKFRGAGQGAAVHVAAKEEGVPRDRSGGRQSPRHDGTRKLKPPRHT